jgi:methylated-DNA-protein-cysteine methyltransferase-like protein
MAITEFSDKAIQLILSIPEGKVATYGQIARLAGRPRAARRVAYLLNSSSDKYKLPWHRVINSQGKVSERPGGGQKRQIKALRKEGIKVDAKGGIDLNRYGWMAPTLTDTLKDLSPEEQEELDRYA